MIRAAIVAGTTASQRPAAARAAAPAIEIDEKASANVASRDEVWRRRKCDRLVCALKKSWTEHAAAAERPAPTSVVAATNGEAHAMPMAKGMIGSATAVITASILARRIAAPVTG